MSTEPCLITLCICDAVYRGYAPEVQLGVSIATVGRQPSLRASHSTVCIVFLSCVEMLCKSEYFLQQSKDRYERKVLSCVLSIDPYAISIHARLIASTF